MGRLASLIFVWPAFCVAAFSEASVSSSTLASLAFNWPGETNTVSRPETLREGGRISPEIPKDSTPLEIFFCKQKHGNVGENQGKTEGKRQDVYFSEKKNTFV